MPNRTSSATLVTLATLTIASALVSTVPVYGSPDSLTLLVARVSVNEATWHKPDIGLVWQVVENRADGHANRLRFLRAHSKRVAGLRPCRSGNCVWTRNLNPYGTVPDGWPSWLDWQRFRPLWFDTLHTARAYVRGDITDRPCDGQPFTWGSPELDRERALAKGLILLDCKGTRNDGYELP
jgi:hypothetical protein